MTGEIIDLGAKRREKFHEKLREMRELGGVAVFGAIGEQNATIIYLPLPKDAPRIQLERIEPDDPDGAA